jgi:hypothetical protein
VKKAIEGKIDFGQTLSEGISTEEIVGRISETD